MSTPKRSVWKRLGLIAGALSAFLLVFVMACRVAVQETYRGIASQRATGLASIWDIGDDSASKELLAFGSIWISRSAVLRARTTTFDQCIPTLRRTVAAHQGHFDELKVESNSSKGRTLVARISLPASELDSTLPELKRLGKVETISESAEDSAVRLDHSARDLAAKQARVKRLKELRHSRMGSLQDAVSWEKELTQAEEALAQAEREQKDLRSTVAQAVVRATYLEQYRPPLETDWSSLSLNLRNSLVQGIGAIGYSVATLISLFLQIGLPVGFWLALLFWPARLAWRRLRRTRTVEAGAS